MKRKYDIGLFQDQFIENIDELESATDFPSHFYQAFFDGKRDIYQKEHTQIKQFDEHWIRVIESYFPSIDTITKRLKSTLRYDEEILPIEKTKKTGPRSIRHLSSHSELIREVDEEDDVIPMKVLSNQSEVEYGIYENRFVMTLISRLQSFVGDRLKIIRSELAGRKDTHLSYDTSFEFSEMLYEMKIELKQKQLINKRNINEHNLSVLERTESLYKLITRLNASEFMRMMKKYKPVSSPIMKTQIILKNPDFKNAYLLWLYLDKYYILDYNLESKTVNKRFSSQYSKQIDQMMLTFFSTFFHHDHIHLDGDSDGKAKFKSKKAVQIKKNLDDFEIIPFVYEVEPQLTNEYFLEKNKAIFKKQFEESIEAYAPRYTLGLKNALTNTLKITNDLYASFFEVNQDDDIFKRLIQEEDPIDSLESAIEKQKISRLIREVKEKDYRESIKLEQKWLKTVQSKQKEFLSYEKESQSKRIKDKIENIEKSYEESRSLEEQKFLKQRELITRKQKEELKNTEKKLLEKIQKEKALLKAKEQHTLAKEKLRLKKQADSKRAKQKEKNDKELEKLKIKHQMQKEKLKANFIKKNEKDKEKLKNSTKQKMKLEEKRLSDIIENERKKLQKHKEDNIKKLKKNETKK